MILLGPLHNNKTISIACDVLTAWHLPEVPPRLSEDFMGVIMADQSFRPALIIVDVQEDFCPPVCKPIPANDNDFQLTTAQNGSLAVPNGRDIVPAINTLLSLPFVLKIATKDWHPKNHISFASNHEGAKPYESMTTVVNPLNPAEKYESRLWPIHCVQGTPGAELIPDLNLEKVDLVVEKGQHETVEMYSAFYAPLKDPRVCDSGLAAKLHDARVTDCYVVGLAGDYCVMSTAVDAAAEGFKTCIVEEGTRSVDMSDGGWGKCKRALPAKGVSVVTMEGEEVRKLRSWAKP